MTSTETTVTEKETAWGRDETEPCEKGTEGCSIRHRSTDVDQKCETW